MNTIISFDRPCEERFEIPRLLPCFPRDTTLELENAGEQTGSHVVRSSDYVLDVKSGDLTLYVRLRL